MMQIVTMNSEFYDKFIKIIRQNRPIHIDGLIKQCYSVFPPNISCRDREGNKLLFYYADFKL